MFVGVILFIFRGTNLYSEVQKLASFSVLKGLFLVGVLQAFYGLLQFIGKYSSNHNFFAITGSFDNPAGFAAVLSLLFPIGVYWCIKSKRFEQRLIFFSVGLVVFLLIISGSRSGLLAVAISSLIIFAIEFQLLSKIQNLKNLKLYFIPTFIILFISLFFLFKWKPDSANGRLLIWKVSTEMIKEKPLFGYGYKGFQANYMDFQAQYFQKNPQSKFKHLADNIIHPFNEFIKITVNFGICGLLLYLSLLSLILWKLFKSKHSLKSILLGCYTSFIILSSFSYPLHYAPIWLLFGHLTFVLFSAWLPGKKLSLLTRIPIIGVCLLGVSFITFKMNNELKWKDIAVKSFQGKTKLMLPNYAKLYPNMRHNELFLYNYGAELNVAGQYKESIMLLNECLSKYNDYDLQMLLADNYQCRLVKEIL
ncbi:MAG TPA: O-antigen ligase family protein [Edaphocola sp.]|nr:O-antigen ligase family protein [Edaphocola sp.]